MQVLKSIIERLPEGEIEQVCIGLRWTAVVSSSESGRRCGLASTRRIDRRHGRDLLPGAGTLESKPASKLAQGILTHPHPLMHSVAMATINSLLPPPGPVAEISDAEALLAGLGSGRHVVVVGHFPFTERLRSRVGKLDVLEIHPNAGDLPAEAADRVLPESDVIAITAMTLLNGTFESLGQLFPKDAEVIMLGPSTPLSAVLFSRGIDHLAGSVVEDIDGVMRGVTQAASYKQLHRLGVRKVIISRP